jgi:predicted nucleic acid-binding protein
MTVVIADTSPINYLVLTGDIEILPELYRQIVVPDAVFFELRDIGAPSKVSDWVQEYPRWMEIRTSPALGDASLSHLDAGEAAAIALAGSEVSGVLLLVDEAAGCLEACRRGIPNTGTLGIVRRAAMEELIDLPSVLNRLMTTNFRVSKSLVQALLAEDSQRRRSND